MSLVKTNNVQIGQSGTATNNFTIYQPTTPDGTLRIGNGNSGSVTDSMTFDSSGNAIMNTGAFREKKAVISASDINLSTGNYFSKTITTTTTFTVSNTAASGNVSSFILDLTNGGSATINWWTGVKWAGGTAPTLTASGRDVLGFFTYDNGTTWTGLVLGKDVK